MLDNAFHLRVSVNRKNNTTFIWFHMFSPKKSRDMKQVVKTCTHLLHALSNKKGRYDDDI